MTYLNVNDDVVHVDDEFSSGMHVFVTDHNLCRRPLWNEHIKKSHYNPYVSLSANIFEIYQFTRTLEGAIN